MTLVVPEQQPPVAFYQEARVNEAEAQRLELMAAYADFASIDVVSEATDRPNAVCVDIGSGDSTSLGATILSRNATARYLPIDIREAAVRRHRDAGFEAAQGYATDLPLPNNTADALHARFTFGWLDKEGRTRAVEEMLRVGCSEAKLAIIDYDWSTAQGPQPVNELVNKVTGIMSAFGFDPTYGDKVTEDMQANLAEYGYSEESGNVVIKTQRMQIQQTMADSLRTIEITTQPLIDKLHEVGLTTESIELLALLNDVRAYAQENPQESMRFPDIVAFSAQLNDESLHTEVLNRIRTVRSMGAESLRQETMVPVGPAELNAYRLPPAMQLQGRQLHAQAYRNHGYVTPEGLNPDGTLIEEIDPQPIIEASTYLGRANKEGTVVGNIRIVDALNGDPRNLPTVIKLIESLGETHPELTNLPFMREGVVVSEASALSKSNQAKDKMLLPKLLLAAWCEAKERNDEYMVMTIVEGTARLLTAAFGDKAFKRIDGDTAVVRLTGKGIRPEGVTLVPFYVHIDTFIEDCKEHFTKNTDSDFAQEAIALFEATDTFVRSRA